MTKPRTIRDRSRVYKAMVGWCRDLKAKHDLTLASMQGRECSDLPCRTFCDHIETDNKGR